MGIRGKNRRKKRISGDFCFYPMVINAGFVIELIEFIVFGGSL